MYTIVINVKIHKYNVQYLTNEINVTVLFVSEFYFKVSYLTNLTVNPNYF